MLSDITNMSRIYPTISLISAKLIFKSTIQPVASDLHPVPYSMQWKSNKSCKQKPVQSPSPIVARLPEIASTMPNNFTGNISTTSFDVNFLWVFIKFRYAYFRNLPKSQPKKNIVFPACHLIFRGPPKKNKTFPSNRVGISRLDEIWPVHCRMPKP